VGNPIVGIVSKRLRIFLLTVVAGVTVVGAGAVLAQGSPPSTAVIVTPPPLPTVFIPTLPPELFRTPIFAMPPPTRTPLVPLSQTPPVLQTAAAKHATARALPTVTRSQLSESGGGEWITGMLAGGLETACEFDAVVTVLGSRITAVRRAKPTLRIEVGLNIDDVLPFAYPFETTIYRASDGRLLAGSTNCRRVTGP